MEVEYHTWGEPIDRNQSAIDQLQGLASAIDLHPFTAIVEFRRNGEQEGLVVDFQVELPQDPPVPIGPIERLLIAVCDDPDERPVVLALRVDFPDVLHLNLTVKGGPKDICIFEEDYREVKSRLTPRLLLDRIADWLARAAVEELHLDDQPLEPFLLSAERIIFDINDIVVSSDKPPIVAVVLVSENPTILRAFRLPDDTEIEKIKKSKVLHLLLPLKCVPWHSRILNYQPQNLEELSALLAQVGVDIEAEARALIARVQDEGTFGAFKGHQLIPIIELPKTRTAGGPVESTEWWSFIINTSIEDLAIKLGVIQKTEAGFGIILGTPESKDLDKIGLAALRPTFALSQSFARLLSGGLDDDPKIVAVGAGALGSQITMNLARQGFGTWTVIDHDSLLPHNLARHALSWIHEGRNKAEALANEICGLLNSEAAAKALPLDLIRHGRHECLEELAKTDVILDFSASHAVARFLATAEFDAPRISVFLGPNARHLIVLAEGDERTVRLDDLEMQLAAAIVETPHLRTIFADPSGKVSYAGSCRDMSVQIPQDIVALQAAVAAHFIKNNARSTSPAINLWEWSDSSLSLQHHEVIVCPVDVREQDDWTVRVSSRATDLMRFYRRRRCPNETGGVLLGKIDYERRTAYIATVLPSPPDSAEWPNAYIRGAKGLKEQVDQSNAMSGGDLTYVGEWHSHPKGCSSDPSAVDHKAHRLLVQEMKKVGFPGLVFIQGDDREPTILIEPQE